MQAIPPEFLAAYQEHDREVTLRKTRLGCFLGILLVPVFAVLDRSVYPEQSHHFFQARIACSLLMASLYPFLGTGFGKRHLRLAGVLILLMPTTTISWMIYITDGAASPYYAGLTLVLMFLAVLLDWTFWQSVASVTLVLLVYLTACFFSPAGTNASGLLSNLFFLVSPGIVIVTGSYFHTQLRIREFVARCELDKNRRQLTESNQKLVELDQIKSRFFANISHELRTPLTLLLSPLESLIHRSNNPLDAADRNMLGIMHANGMRLLKLINDLLDLVRLESGRMEVKGEPIEINAFIKGLSNAAQQMATEKGLRLEMSAEPGLGAILADRDKLEKIFLNLVFNALKFTPKDGSVKLHARREADNLITTVSDTGMGISAKNLPFIFDRFWQADGSSKRKYQGVGIGLSLVKELAELHGGKVSVASEEGKGTVFTVSIPFVSGEVAAGAAPAKDDATAPPPAPAAAKAPGAQSEEWLVNLYRRAELFPAIAPPLEAPQTTEPSHDGDQPRLLVADDEPDMLRFLKSQLQVHYRVIEALDGKQAVEKAIDSPPDIILLDMNMPEKDGLQVCRELRAQASTQLIPIIMLTARADEPTKLTALAAGANDFLTKPFSTSELHVRIRNLLEAHHYRQRLALQKQVLESTIEQLKETETQLVQSEKLASLGRMSAGIIHEINNPLNFATTGLYALRNKAKLLKPEDQSEYSDILKDIEEGVVRVKNIVTDLKTFSHPDAGHRDQVEVAEVVAPALKFLSGEWRDKVKIEQAVPEHQTIWASKNMVLQVILNLLQNSFDALGSKSFTNGEQPTIRIEGRLERGRSIISIRDNGMGIDPKHIDKVFDPFFTTKDVGEGMGLGLSICYRIVQKYDGRITVRSEPGRFCEFTLDFPAKG